MIYIEKVDNIVMTAFEQGFAIPNKDDLMSYAIIKRLNIYGYIDDDRYYLNELGVRYAMEGCSVGIRKKQEKDEYVVDLSIKATKKSMANSDIAIGQSEKALKKSKVNNIIAGCALVISIVSTIISLVVLIK